MVVLPEKGGYWVDGAEPDCAETPANPPRAGWRAKFETDDTAKCYRRFFVGRVSLITIMLPLPSSYTIIIMSLFRRNDNRKARNAREKLALSQFAVMRARSFNRNQFSLKFTDRVAHKNGPIINILLG